MSDARLLALNSYENRVYQVGIEGGEPVIAKFYRPGRWSDEQILEEHAFALELAELEIPVVAPLVKESGASLLDHQGFRFALFPRRGGYPPELDNPDSLFVLGRTLGRLHRVGSSRPFRVRPSLDVPAMLQAHREFLLANFIPGDLISAYESLTADLLRAIEPLWKEVEAGDFLRCHGDCHGGNILWRDAHAHFVDLDDCVMAPAIQDLWMFLSGERSHREGQLAELIAGYEEFMDFSPRQLRWVEVLRTFRLIHYAAWLSRRWDDPAFPRSFSWFNTNRYWSDHVLELREQLAALGEPPLRLL